MKCSRVVARSRRERGLPSIGGSGIRRAFVFCGRIRGAQLRPPVAKAMGGRRNRSTLSRPDCFEFGPAVHQPLDFLGDGGRACLGGGDFISGLFIEIRIG